MVSYVVLIILLILLIAILSIFRPTATQKITDNLYVVLCGVVNFYAYTTDAGTILFDTGINSILAKRGLEKLSISPDSVKYIFLTHSDFDHAGGLNAFNSAKIYIAKSEVPMINGETPRRFFLYNTRLSSYNTMSDGETITIGKTKIQLFDTPGHTIGSASYLIDNRFLISGDLLRISKGGKITPFLWLMNMNHSQDIKSIEMMKNHIENAEYLLTAHTGVYKSPSKS